MRHGKAFTLIEVVMVVILLSIISGFALVRFNVVTQQTREQDAINQLKAIHAANAVYYERARPPGYLSGSLSLDGSGGINESLGLSIFPNGLTYSYNGGSGSYTATATDPSGFAITITEAPVGTGNPYCSAGSCPTLP